MTFKLTEHGLELNMTESRYTGHRVHYDYQLSVNGETIFEGDDFSSGISDPMSHVVSLLGFLTLRRGDTDASYFDHYTKVQFDFSESDVAEEIRMLCYDYEYSRSIDPEDADYNSVMESVERLKAVLT